EDEGDADLYIISERLAVERRASNSFVNGIMDKSLFANAIFQRERFGLPVLIVEGTVNYEFRGMDPQAVRGALTSMVIEYGLNVVSTQDTEETAHLLAMMIRQEQIGIPEISLIPKRKATTLPDMQRRVIEMLPGCGRVMARDLLQHFGSVERIVRATVAELRKVRGVGAKKARQIQQVLTAEYEALDTERQLEDAIEADHSLLFTQPVKLLARQHFIYDDEEDRHIVDLVFLDPRANELILVELKRGKLETDHREQLFRYLSHADESPLLRSYLEAGTAPRGILASPEPGKLKARRKNVTIEAVDTQRVIEVLKKLRRRRMKE
ncbi:MAG: helix-hairpin-helix domain-containing protein, partial [Planctomycetota bacterium]|nr:helix-hairpin-helix domain-containing protein [Planctomycetota bacterium]